MWLMHIAILWTFLSCSISYCDITAVQWCVYCAVVRSAAHSAPIGLYTTSLLGVVQRWLSIPHSFLETLLSKKQLRYLIDFEYYSTRYNSTICYFVNFFILQYFTYSILVVMLGCAVFQQLGSLTKLLLLLTVAVTYLALIETIQVDLLNNYDILQQAYSE